MSLAFRWQLAHNAVAKAEREQSRLVFKGLCQVQTGEALNYQSKEILMLEQMKVKHYLKLSIGILCF